jgi:DNA mismatch repair protein MutH
MVARREAPEATGRSELISTPGDEAELLRRARDLAGRTLVDVARSLERMLPPDLGRHKGFVGRLIEDALGATASSRPRPDFEALGVELKTIPIDRRGRARESTFVATAPLESLSTMSWEDSPIRKKLARVLWVVVEADPEIAALERRIGSSVLWSPSAVEEAELREDFEDIVSVIAHGYIDSITAHRGKWLQLRPKAANARARRQGPDDEGGTSATLPRGFYLRRTFIQRLIDRHFAR